MSPLLVHSGNVLDWHGVRSRFICIVGCGRGQRGRSDRICGSGGSSSGSA